MVITKKEKFKGRFSRACYLAIRWLVKLFYPRISVEGTENLPGEASIIVSNHTKMNGPISCELYFPGERAIWCAGEMMHMKEVPEYAFNDFWGDKPQSVRWFYKLLSYIIAPIAACIFNNARTVPVYHDARLMHTFRATMDALSEGKNVVIFPEHDAPHNHIINDFQDRFIDIAKIYYRRSGKRLSFVPMYIAPTMKKMYIGRAIQFDPEAPMAQERWRICEYLMHSVTDIAVSLPPHTVVPYNNVTKKHYPMNTGGETDGANEKTCC